MSDFGWAIALVVLIIFFVGDPDLHDLILKQLGECK